LYILDLLYAADENIDFYDRLDTDYIIPLSTTNFTFTWDEDLMKILNDQYPV
jgi:hypothetical protein